MSTDILACMFKMSAMGVYLQLAFYFETIPCYFIAVACTIIIYYEKETEGDSPDEDDFLG